jgi:hypothetical protein
MQLPPISISDLNLLLGLSAIFLLITSELSSFRYGRINLAVNKKKLRAIAHSSGILFFLTVVIRIIGMVS